MLSDIEISRAATLRPIAEVGAKLGIAAEAIEPYGRAKAKVSLDWLQRQPARARRLRRQFQRQQRRIFHSDANGHQRQLPDQRHPRWQYHCVLLR